MLALFTALYAALLAFGSLQEAIVGGFRDGQPVHLAVGIVGAALSAEVFACAAAIWRGRPVSRPLAIYSGMALIAFNVLAGIAPLHNVGKPMVVLGLVTAALLLVFTSPRFSRRPLAS